MDLFALARSFNRFVCHRCVLVADFVLRKGLVAELRAKTLVAVHLEPSRPLTDAAFIKM